LNPKTKFRKRPLKPFQKKISSLLKNGGDSKNIEKSRNLLKLQVIQPYPTFRN